MAGKVPGGGGRKGRQAEGSQESDGELHLLSGEGGERERVRIGVLASIVKARAWKRVGKGKPSLLPPPTGQYDVSFWFFGEEKLSLSRHS